MVCRTVNNVDRDPLNNPETAILAALAAEVSHRRRGQHRVADLRDDTTLRAVTGAHVTRVKRFKLVR